MALPKMLRSVPTGKPVSKGAKVLYENDQWVILTYDQPNNNITLTREDKKIDVRAIDINCYWLKH